MFLSILAMRQSFKIVTALSKMWDKIHRGHSKPKCIPRFSQSSREASAVLFSYIKVLFHWVPVRYTDFKFGGKKALVSDQSRSRLRYTELRYQWGKRRWHDVWRKRSKGSVRTCGLFTEKENAAVWVLHRVSNTALHAVSNYSIIS